MAKELEYALKCFHCKKPIMLENELALYDVSSTKNKSTQKFHKSCVEKYKADRAFKDSKKKKKKKTPDVMNKEHPEWEDWSRLYEFVKYKILNYKAYMNLPKYAVHRLQALHKGDIFNTKGVGWSDSEGYSYKVIYATFLLCKAKIENATHNKKFKSDMAKFNYIMAIVQSQINEVEMREQRKINMEKRLESRRLENVSLTKQSEDYEASKKMREEQKSIKDDLFEDLW